MSGGSDLRVERSITCVLAFQSRDEPLGNSTRNLELSDMATDLKSIALT